MMADVDVLVVGGGPVGLAAAIEARLSGLTVTVVEPRQGAIDKACGEGLMPGVVPALARLGVELSGYPLRGVRYLSATRSVEHLWDHGSGLGVRRTVLHAALLARTRELGANIITTRVVSVRQDEHAVSAAGITARYLLAADGLHSTVREIVGVGRPPQSRRRYGLRQHFRLEPWSDLIEVHWAKRCEAYVTPVNEHTVGVALLGRQGLHFADGLAEIPALTARLTGAESVSSLKGAGPFRQRTSRRRVGRVMLVGDSSGYVDAITGEGIRVGLAHVQAAIACILLDDPARYERDWSQCTRDFRVLTAALVAVASSPLRGAIVPAAVALPRVFGGIVERLAR